ncbi:DUF1328 domain-containing protein [Pseudaestuariivita sp.]|uniref:DUF1328 domain-containing protein n=1 Tax=Pseudaestuariivita sp. TaxID=2211669 RepID=UPI00405A0EE6
MLTWALTFLAVAIVAGVFGFSEIALASAEVAQITCVVFLLLGLVALVVRWADQE